MYCSHLLARVAVMASTKITHVAWDFDGVLVDSEQVYSDVNNIMMSQWGKQFTLDMKLAMMGTKKSEAVGILLAKSGLEGKVTPTEYIERYDVELDKALTNCAELPGASKLINYFEKHRIPQAICTGSDSHEFRIKTERNYQRWLSQIPLRVMSGDDSEVAHGKPAPDPYLVTMRRFSSPPAHASNVLVFEDSINGACSALAAGCTCVIIPQRHFLNEAGLAELERLRPNVDLIDSLEQFEPSKYNLPAF